MASAADFTDVGFVQFPFALRNFIVWHMACFVVTVLEAIMFLKPARSHQAPIVVPLYSVDGIGPAEQLFSILVLFHF